MYIFIHETSHHLTGKVTIMDIDKWNNDQSNSGYYITVDAPGQYTINQTQETRDRFRSWKTEYVADFDRRMNMPDPSPPASNNDNIGIIAMLFSSLMWWI